MPFSIQNRRSTSPSNESELFLNASLDSTNTPIGECYELCVFDPVHREFLETKQDQLRLLSWNIDGLKSNYLEARTRSVVQTIRVTRADVVYLQEVVDTSFEILGAYLSETFHIVRPEMPADLPSFYYCVILLSKNKFGASSDVIDFKTFWFPTSQMARHLLVTRCSFSDTQDNFYFLTAHLESCRESSEERKDQLYKSFVKIQEFLQKLSAATAIFGGDFNLRDQEAHSVLAKLKKTNLTALDVWEDLGRRPEARYTWNINHCADAPVLRYALRMRLDRVYLCHAHHAKQIWKPSSMQLVGKWSLMKTQGYPSDHLGLLVLADFRKGLDVKSKKKYCMCLHAQNMRFERTERFGDLRNIGNDALLREDKGGYPDLVRKSEIKRGRDTSIVDKVIELDCEWRKKSYLMETAKKELNEVNRAIGKNEFRDAKNREEFIEKAKILKQNVKCLEKDCQEAISLRDSSLAKIGNLVHSSVKDSQNEEENEIIRVYGHLKDSTGCLRHYEIMEILNLANLKKGAEIAGHRGYFLKGAGVMLNMALIQYGLSFLRKKDYIDIQPPFFLRREIMEETAELADFSENLYQIAVSDTKERHENKDDLLLIATSEQPISALHRNEFLAPKSLPYRYAGYSTCFRKEAGAHGTDVRGIFRIHQFEKVEQFVITTPEQSEAMHEEMLQIAEEFYQSLEIPYRVVSIVAGALNNAASKKYDIEAWFPGHQEYRELVSCSNCLDYQSRDLEIRCGHPKKGDREKLYVHMLNATLVASQRTLCCLLENYQTSKGVKIPRVLIPYMDGIEFLAFPS